MIFMSKRSMLFVCLHRWAVCLRTACCLAAGATRMVLWSRSVWMAIVASSPVIMALMGTARCKQHVILFVTPGVSLVPFFPIWHAICIGSADLKKLPPESITGGGWGGGEDRELVTEKGNGRSSGGIYVLMPSSWVHYFFSYPLLIQWKELIKALYTGIKSIAPQLRGLYLYLCGQYLLYLLRWA